MCAEITTPITAELLRGAVELESTRDGVLPHRLPAWARRRGADEQLLMAESQPSGVRVVMRTRASRVELETVRTAVTYTGAPPRPEGVYDLLVDGQLVDQATGTGGHVLEIDMRSGSRTTRLGESGVVRFSGLPTRPKIVEIWLPHTETTELLGLRTDAPIEPVASRGRVWVHHGSSISHGSAATHPTGTWPVQAAQRGGVELVNLGFGGSALLDSFTARVISGLVADVISVKVGINLVNADLMRRRALVPAVHGFLDTIRDGHPETPLLLISPLTCPIHESTPGPCMPEFTEGGVRFQAMGDPADVAAGKLTLQVVREALEEVVAAREDKHLGFLDGRALYGPREAEEMPLPDGLHPDGATHRMVGARFAERVFGPAGSFAA